METNNNCSLDQGNESGGGGGGGGVLEIINCFDIIVFLIPASAP